MFCCMCGSKCQDGSKFCPNCGAKLFTGKKDYDTANTIPKQDPPSNNEQNELQKLFLLARRSLKSTDYEQAAKYYDMILFKEPTSWEASFYNVYCRAMNCRIIDIVPSANKIKNCLENTVTMIRDYVPDKDEQKKALLRLASSCTNASTVFCESLISHYKPYVHGTDIEQVNKNRGELQSRYLNAIEILLALAEAINEKRPPFKGKNDICFDLLDAAIDEWLDVLEYTPTIKKSRNLYIEAYDLMVDSIKKFDPDFKAEKISFNGCYIATAVYGSYDCPEVWVLRRYRDNVLQTTGIGRIFIHVYYAISPTLVHYFGKNTLFLKLWKKFLNRMVLNLQSKGFESSPYTDK